MDGQYWKGDRTMSTNEWLLTSDFWQFLEPWHGRWNENEIFIALCTDNIYDLENERWLLGDMIDHVDGTHATNTTNEKWVKQIIKAIITNRGEKTPDSDQININTIINHNRQKPKRNPRHTTLKSPHRTVTKPHTPIVNPHPAISDSSESDSDEVVKRPWQPQ